MTWIFDILFWIVWAIAHGAAACAALWVGDALWGEHLVSHAAAVVAAYLAFLHAFVLTLGVLRTLVQPRLREGSEPIGFNRFYVAWGIQSVFQGVFTTSVFARQVHIVFYLRWLYYRLMGMRLSLSTMIGTQATIRQAELIELGAKTIVGEGAFVIPHLSPDGKHHLQKRVRIGARSVVGGRATLGPGITIGTDSVIGAGALLTTQVTVGDGVTIGANATLMPGVVVGDGARVAPGALVTGRTVIGASEVWAGNPATRQS